MMMKVLDVLLSAMLVGAFVFVAVFTAEALYRLKDVAEDHAARVMIELKQKARKRRHENSESRH